jgi:glucose/arabinose dehydrogenase
MSVMQLVRASALLGISSLAVVSAVAMQRSATRSRDVVRLYSESCANCHGPKLTGGQGPSLADEEWKYGGDDASIAKSIHTGQPATGMPAFGGALSAQDIRALVIYIREEGAKARRAQTTFAKPGANISAQSELHAFRLETVTSRVDAPWGLAFLPDGRILVTEKRGRLRVVERGVASQPIRGVPAVYSESQAGLLDVALHPEYEKNGWIYLSYSDPGPNGSAMTAIVRGHLQDGAFIDQQHIFKVDPALYRRGGVHFGSRFVFDGSGHLFFSIGDRGQGKDAQDLTRPNGKVHRIRDDGRLPDDNPFAGQPGAFRSIWSYGNRNAQGLVRHSVTGDLWEVEHGPRGGDEVNVIRPGLNYGWPVITYGMNYDGTPMTDLTAQEGMEQPIIQWTPSIAVSSIDFYVGSAFSKWSGNLLVGTLAAQELRRLEIEGTRVTRQEVLFRGVGRIRDVVVGPDGLVYLAMHDPDRIARLVPADAGAPRTAQER